MYSTGFFVKLKKSRKFEISEEEILESMPRGVDYVTFITSLEKDVKWLTEASKFKAKEVQEGYLITNVKEAIEDYNNKHLKEVKEAYEVFKKKPTVFTSYDLAERAFDRFGFYFVVEWDVMPEIEFIEYYLEPDKVDEFYIYKSFNYHF